MNKWVKVGVILIVLILLFIPTIIAMKYVAISQIYSHFVESVSNLTGLNKYLVKAGVALMLIPLYIGLKFFFSINKKRRYIGASILITLLAVYNLSLYNFTKDLYFAFSEGKALKWYALTPEGVKFFDRAGVEPVYGITLKPVTPDVIRNLKLLQKGDFRPVDPNNVQFFNPITGEPQIWYYQYPDGSLEFYDKPGYHPITGDPLKPATKQIYFEWQEKAKTRSVSVNPEGNKKEKGQQFASPPPKETPPPRVAVAVAPPTQKTIIWEKWKDVELSTEWSEYIDTPTKWDRVVAPPGKKVEILYENGKYIELNGSSVENRREGIEIKAGGRFKLKGLPGAKAAIWIGKI